MALGCYEALKELGKRIPEDVAVIGYDDREIAQFTRPPLTTVLLPHFEMGTLAAEYLINHAVRPARPAGADQGRMPAGRTRLCRARANQIKGRMPCCFW